MNQLTKGQYIALQHTLTEFPENKSFDEILLAIFEESEEILIWEPFENFDKDRIVNHIVNLSEDIDSTWEMPK
jgi:hypothetical protein